MLVFTINKGRDHFWHFCVVGPRYECIICKLFMIHCHLTAWMDLRLVKYHVSEKVNTHFPLWFLHPQCQDLFCNVNTEPSRGSLGYLAAKTAGSSHLGLGHPALRKNKEQIAPFWAGFVNDIYSFLATVLKMEPRASTNVDKFSNHWITSYILAPSFLSACLPRESELGCFSSQTDPGKSIGFFFFSRYRVWNYVIIFRRAAG